MENNLLEIVISSIDRNREKIFIVNKNIEYSYSKFFSDARRIYPYIKEGRILLKPVDKYFYALAVIAGMFKHSMLFLSNKDSSIYDDYKFNQIIDDEFIKGILDKNEEPVPVNELNTNINEDDPFIVVLSSGTSLKPKPIVLSYKAVRSNIQAGFRIFHLDPNWTFVSLLPLDHAFGITSDFLDMLLSGTRVVYTYSLIEYFMYLRKYSPDMINIPITILKTLQEMIKEQGKAVLGNNIKQILVGGSKCYKEIINFFKEYDITVCTSYGLTECAPCVSICSPEHFMLESDGLVFDCHHIRFSDEGEIIISGDSIMLNYLEDYDKGEIVKEVHTKDVGYLKDGYLFVTGRLDNLIIMDNGYKIQPETFEKELLIKHPYIKECVIYYIDNVLYLDVIMDESHIKELRKELNHLDIHINVVDEIKKNALGKISRVYYKNGKKEEN